MFTSHTRSIVTVAVVLEGGIAGWALGAGWLGLLVMVAAVTLADTVWGIARRGVIADIAGLEVALALAVMLAVGAPATHDRAHGGRVRRVARARRPRHPAAAAVRGRVLRGDYRRAAAAAIALTCSRSSGEAVVRQELPSASGEPSSCVIVPPASRTITSTAVVSHVRTVGSTITCAAPRATSMCPQKSPSPRTRHAVAESSE